MEVIIKNDKIIDEIKEYLFLLPYHGQKMSLCYQIYEKKNEMVITRNGYNTFYFYKWEIWFALEYKR